jgi:hypothetical protein
VSLEKHDREVISINNLLKPAAGGAKLAKGKHGAPCYRGNLSCLTVPNVA